MAADLRPGVEQVVEVGVLVGELVSAQPGFFRQSDGGQVTGRRERGL